MSDVVWDSIAVLPVGSAKTESREWDYSRAQREAYQGLIAAHICTYGLLDPSGLEDGCRRILTCVKGHSDRYACIPLSLPQSVGRQRTRLLRVPVSRIAYVRIRRRD